MAKLSDIGKIVREALEQKAVLNAAGEAAIRAIPKRTRLGKGVSENLGQTHALPQLKPKTVRNRQLLKKKGELTGQGATPKKSGVNKSGELLNSVEYTVKNGILDIHLSKDQQEKAKALLKIDKNYKFMAVSKAEFNRMLKAMTKQIEQILKGIKFTDL